MSACSLADYIEKSSQQSALDKYIYFLCIYICNMGTHTITRAGTRNDRFCFIYLCVYICLCDKYIYQVQAEVVASGEPKSMKMPRLLLHCCCFYYYSCHCCFFLFHSFRKKSALPGKISNCTRLMKPKVLLHVRSICVVRFAWWVTSVTPADEIRWELLFLNINKSTIFHTEFH